MPLHVKEYHTLAPHTTIGIGGPARYYCECKNAQELKEACNYAHENELPIFILGGGSNLLIDDDGFDGLVIRPSMDDIRWEALDGGKYKVVIEAACCFDKVVIEACQKNLAGIEALSGIPGTAAGAAVQNIGAYGQEISEVFESANVIDTQTGETRQLTRADMAFAYRASLLKCPQNTLCIIDITLNLRPFDADAATKSCIEHGFKRLTQIPIRNASELRERILETRREKGMVYDKNDPNSISVGSFFVNPVVSQNDAMRMNASSVLHAKKTMPMFNVEGGVKLSAAWLIEQSGFSRGYIHKGAGLSQKHTLAIINRDHASSKDVIELAQLIAERVFHKFRIELSPEVIYLSKSKIEILPLQFIRIA